VVSVRIPVRHDEFASNAYSACAMSIPSALTLIVRIFPDPTQQARAVGIFGGCGAIADGIVLLLLAPPSLTALDPVLGFIIGAVFVQWMTYRWIFWFTGLVALLVGLIGAVVMPVHLGKAWRNDEKFIPTWRDFDIVGTSVLTGITLVLDHLWRIDLTSFLLSCSCSFYLCSHHRACTRVGRPSGHRFIGCLNCIDACVFLMGSTPSR